MSTETFDSLADNAKLENPWFTKENVKLSLNGICQFLTTDILQQWTNRYSLSSAQPKTIGLVAAGNIPLVGFHDFLCILISGNRIQLKLSSKDSKLFNFIIQELLSLEPDFADRIVQKERLEDFDAIIATGSDNSARYFEFYFGKYRHIIRKNRTSVGIIDGNETDADLQSLGYDIFSYFGLGCRNVSKVYVPAGYDVTKLLASWDAFQETVYHHKYSNNYDYQKSILLVNGSPFLDNGFILLQENEKLVSPISVLYYEYYSNTTDLHAKLELNESKIQCVVGNQQPATIKFGQAQFPQVWDYADQLDTLKFLSELN